MQLLHQGGIRYACTSGGWYLLLAACLVAAQAQAAPPANPEKQLSLTVYNKDLALIEHVRAINMPAGRHRIEFKGVSARIVPQTVSFGAPGLELIEQNFDYDLLTPAKLMEKAVGQTVRIVRTNPGSGTETTETAEVLSAVGAWCCASVAASRCCVTMASRPA